MVEPAEAAIVRRGEWDAPEFLRGARALVADSSVHEALYDGLRAKIGHLVRSGADEEEVKEWREALVRVTGLALSRNESKSDSYGILAARLDVLRDLSADVLAQLSAYSVSNLRQQPHFQSCLEAIAAHSGTMSRSTLIAVLGLKEANGTRVLKVLEAARLIRRTRDGGNVIVSLTIEGRKTIAQWRSPPARVTGGAAVFNLRIEKIDGVDRDEWSAQPHAIGIR